jgi:hypothetical protein
MPAPHLGKIECRRASWLNQPTTPAFNSETQPRQGGNNRTELHPLGSHSSHPEDTTILLVGACANLSASSLERIPSPPAPPLDPCPHESFPHRSMIVSKDRPRRRPRRLGTSAVGAGTPARTAMRKSSSSSDLGARKRVKRIGSAYRELWQGGQLRF